MKTRRQMKILTIIKKRDIATQSDLVRELAEEGIQTTQATVSRDIKELGLVKAPTKNGSYRYTEPSAVSRSEISEHLLSILQNSVIELSHSENILVINTLPATAQTVAEAIDALDWPEILGTLAGERIVFAVICSRDEMGEVVVRLKKLCNRGGSGQTGDENTQA